MISINQQCWTEPDDHKWWIHCPIQLSPLSLVTSQMSGPLPMETLVQLPEFPSLPSWLISFVIRSQCTFSLYQNKPEVWSAPYCSFALFLSSKSCSVSSHSMCPLMSKCIVNIRHQLQVPLWYSKSDGPGIQSDPCKIRSWIWWDIQI